MDTKALKDKILQLAIQGKLVPQNENDEPASVLLERIKKEKEQLIKNKVIKKEKPLPEITNEEKLFDLPENWELKRLRDITILIGDGLHGTPLYNENGDYYFINGNNLLNGKICLTEATKKVSKEEYKKYKKDLNNNTILYSINGTIGNLAYYNNEKIMLGKSSAYINVSQFIVKEYIGMILISPYSFEIFSSKLSGTTIKNLSLQSIRNLVIPLPPLEEQKRIVAKVDSLFKLIDELESNKEDLLQNISDARNKVLQLAIEGKLVPQNEKDEPASVLLEKIKEEKEQLVNDKIIKKEKPLSEINEDEKIFKLPKSWEWVKLGNISQKIHYGYTASAEENNTGIKLLRITDIQDNKVNWNTVPFCKIEKNKLDSCKLNNDDLLIARTGGTIGKSFLVTNIEHEAVFASYLIRVKPLSNISAKYIKIFLDAPFYWEQLRQKSQGTGQPNVNAVSLSNLVMPLPPLEEQERIVAKVDAIMNYLDILEKEIK
ncbi:restriction endonuclease subunit S [Clostridium perfringens]